MSRICGTDLGTAYSAISNYDSETGRVETIELENSDGGRLLKSVVMYPGPSDDPVVGDAAWNASRRSPERVVALFKRAMGTSWRTAPIDGREYSAPEVSSEVLKVLAQEATHMLAETVDEVVITVPAYFGDNERAATKEAGQLAGLKVHSLLPEPHAAALAYSVDMGERIDGRYLLVYDLGGGTFDVALIHAQLDDVGQIKIDTLCKDGNRSLGGTEWDEALEEIVDEKINAKYGTHPRTDPRNKPILTNNCERGKRALTRLQTTSIIGDSENHEAEVTRSEFEDRTTDLLYQTQALLENVLEDAETQHGITRDQIDVLLAGGSTRMPMVAQMIEGVMGKPPIRHRNPDLLVTIGAAYAPYLGKIRDTVFPVGVEVLEVDDEGRSHKVVTNVIPSGCSYGEARSKLFGTAKAGQRRIKIVLYEGDSVAPDECRRLMEYTISDLPAGRPRGVEVKVELVYDDDGILRGKATDELTGKTVPILVERGEGLVEVGSG